MGFQIKRNKGPISDINITPFVDVVLVILITFVISAPLIYSNIDLNLPKTKKVQKLSLNANQVILSLTSTGEFYIGRQKFLESELVEKIKNEFQIGRTEILYLQADYNLKYGFIANLLTFLKVNGITNISLVTEIEKTT